MGKKKRIVVFTGAGVSADSGIATFRDADGLWAKYRIEEVCTPEALKNNREKVIEFYNMRRKVYPPLSSSPPLSWRFSRTRLADLPNCFEIEY